VKGNYWSEGNQAYFLDGFAYGLTENLCNICIGMEADVLKALSKNTEAESPTINQILESELRCRNEKKVATAGVRRTRISFRHLGG